MSARARKASAPTSLTQKRRNSDICGAAILQYSPRRGQRKKCTLAMEILRSCLASRFCIVAVLSLKIAHFRQHFPSNRIIHYSLYSNHLARGARVLALDPRLSALDFGCGLVVYFL